MTLRHREADQGAAKLQWTNEHNRGLSALLIQQWEY